MITKSLLITFDYELFLGKRSGSVENCLIRPTELILEVLKKHNQKSLFFIDTTYLLRLSEIKGEYQKAATDYDKICKQLIALAKEGHWLFHHLHPHWLDAHYLPETNEWDLTNNQRFVFSSISEAEREKIFSFSDSFLNQIYQEACVNRTPNGFRAGGLFIEPFGDFIPYFKKFNISNEFSVVPNTQRGDYPFAYDFCEVPVNRAYNFNEKINQENNNGCFKEYPITQIKISGIAKLMNSIHYRLKVNKSEYKVYGDGNSVSKNINQKKSKRKVNHLLNMKIPASIEFLNPVNVSLYHSFMKKNNYFHLLSHPKLLTPVSISVFDAFLKKSAKTANIVNPEF